MVQFSSAPHLEFSLDSYLTKQQVKERIKRTVFRSAYSEGLLFFWAVNDFWTENFLKCRRWHLSCVYTSVVHSGKGMNVQCLWSVMHGLSLSLQADRDEGFQHPSVRWSIEERFCAGQWVMSFLRQEVLGWCTLPSFAGLLQGCAHVSTAMAYRSSSKHCLPIHLSIGRAVCSLPFWWLQFPLSSEVVMNC